MSTHVSLKLSDHSTRMLISQLVEDYCTDADTLCESLCKTLQDPLNALRTSLPSQSLKFREHGLRLKVFHGGCQMVVVTAPPDTAGISLSRAGGILEAIFSWNALMDGNSSAP